MNTKQKQKIIQDWIEHHGAADFDCQKKDIILFDGGLFSVIKETKVVPKKKMVQYQKKGEKLWTVDFVPIKREGKIVKEKREYYKAMFWFEELDSTIRYLQSMKKMLQSLGYNTGYKHNRKKGEKT